MNLHLIYARSANGVIGKDGALPWHLPEDLAHFRKKTMGADVIMGRKSWDSLPPRFRPLPGRRNIVVTRNPDWHAQGAVRAGSLHEAIAHCAGDTDAWLIGGAELYKHGVALAATAEVTEIEADFEGDVYAPALGPEWVETARERHVSGNGMAFSFVTYKNATIEGLSLAYL